MSELRWYALRCRPQRERMTAKILRYHGLVAEVKTERRLRRRTKWDKERKLRSFVAAPSYVFVAFDAGKPMPWHVVFSYHFVWSVVSVGGVPAELNHEAVVRFLGYDDADKLPSYMKHFRTRGETFRVGEEVIIGSGAFTDHRMRVEDIRDGEAKFITHLLGRTIEVSVPVDDCVKAA
jgi:transcription antitermination factor NusG